MVKVCIVYILCVTSHFCLSGALIYLLDLFCNSTHPQVRTQTAELFSKMTSDKLVGPKVHWLCFLICPLTLFLYINSALADRFTVEYHHNLSVYFSSTRSV